MPKAPRQKPPVLNPEAEWFGKTRVSPADKTARVRRVFDSVATNYDLMNDLMSGGLHRLWKDRLVELMRPRAGQSILDVAGGTGDIALRCLSRAKGKARIIVCDINPSMLDVGKAKAIDHGWLPCPPPLEGGVRGGVCKGNSSIQWLTANAEALPFPNRSFDTVCIAFGLRNVTHVDTALAEFARVLKPGGRFFCLEFSPGVAPWLKEIYDLYCSTVLPWLGETVAEDRDAYRYLAESIQKFPPQPALARRMEEAGLERVKWENLTGGIAVIHSGWRL